MQKTRIVYWLCLMFVNRLFVRQLIFAFFSFCESTPNYFTLPVHYFILWMTESSACARVSSFPCLRDELNALNRGKRRSMHMIFFRLHSVLFLEWNYKSSRGALTRNHLPSTVHARPSEHTHTHTPGTVIITAWYTLLCDSGDNNFSRLRSSGIAA